MEEKGMAIYHLVVEKDSLWRWGGHCRGTKSGSKRVEGGGENSHFLSNGARKTAPVCSTSEEPFALERIDKYKLTD